MAQKFVDSSASGGGSGSSGSPWTADEAASNASNGDYLEWKGTFNRTGDLVFTQSGIRHRGFTTTPGDGGKATIKAVSGCTKLFNCDYPASGNTLQDLILDANSVASYCVFFKWYNNIALRCKLTGATGTGSHADNGESWNRFCEITGNNVGTDITSEDCYIHANSGGVAYGAARRCIISNNGGNGLYLPGVSIVEDCRIYGNTGSAIKIGNSGSLDLWLVRRNVIVSNGGYGIECLSPADCPPTWIQNAFYNNTSGARALVGAGEGDITLTGDPFVNAAGGDFSFNNTAGAGAALRGLLKTLPGSSTNDYPDLGGAQHQDSGGGGGGGGGTIPLPVDMNGGFQ